MTNSPWRDRIVLSVITILILCAFWLELPGQFGANESFDYRCCYERAAKNWIDGKGFAYDDGHFAANYPPGFPVLLAAVFLVGKVIGESLALHIFIALCDVASVVALYAIGRAMGGPWLGRIAGACLITYPFFLWMSKQPNSEVPYLPLVLWGFYGYVRLVSSEAWKWAALSGACWALSALIRPISVLGAFVTAACLVLFAGNRNLTKRVLLGVFLIAVNLATLMPWEIIARNVTGRWILVGDNSGVGYVDGLTFGLPVFDHPAAVPPDVYALMERALAQKTRLTTTGGYLGFLKEEAQTHPGAFLKLMYIKITRAWYATYEGRFEGVNKLVELVYIAAACIGSWWMRRTMKAEALGIVALVLYFWFMSVLVLPILRYMVPATAIMLLPVAVLLKEIAERWNLLPGPKPQAGV